MLVHRAYKFRIYPNKDQTKLINRTIGCSRFVFNHFLEKWRTTYLKTGKGMTYKTCSSQLTHLKKELDWLKEVDSIALQTSLKNLSNSYARFFRKQSKAPRFKSKKTRSNPTPQNARTIILRLLRTKSNYQNSDLFHLLKVVKWMVGLSMLRLDVIQVVNSLYLSLLKQI
ncbi:transposase [Aquibacillus albus]|uniref:Transposase n=1 Tax=Aquibacillus albus TaxID=1168171 RepID=A0ABS2N3E4_9BACI|nr:transposase [Aquibacillus albus]